MQRCKNKFRAFDARTQRGQLSNARSAGEIEQGSRKLAKYQCKFQVETRAGEGAWSARLQTSRLEPERPGVIFYGLRGQALRVNKKLPL